MLFAILSSMLVTALVLMLAFPRTPTGRWLHRILVEGPAGFFMDFTWAKLGQLVISFAVVIFLISIGPEGMALLAVAGADSALLEVMLALWLASASGNIAGVFRAAVRIAAGSARLVRAVFAPRNRQRSSRPRKVRAQRKNDDQAEPGWAFA
jgi:hypothetical protein